RLNFLNFIALPITFGIGSEYPFNIYDRTRLLRGDATRAVTLSGGAVALCSYTTVVGYGSLLFSDNQSLQSFGWFAISGEIACISAALFIVPSLLHTFGARRAKKAGNLGGPPRVSVPRSLSLATRTAPKVESPPAARPPELGTREGRSAEPDAGA